MNAPSFLNERRIFMKTKKVTTKDLIELLEKLSKRGVDHAKKYKKLIEDNEKLSLNDRDNLQNIISDEFVDRGLKNEDYEPTEYGLYLEEMIDLVARI